MADLQKTVRAAWPDVTSVDPHAAVSKDEAKRLHDRQAAAFFGSLVPGVYLYASVYLRGQGEGEYAIEREKGGGGGEGWRGRGRERERASARVHRMCV